MSSLEPGFLETKQSLTPDQLYSALRSRPEGLTTSEAQQRLEAFGLNKLREAKGKPLILRFLSNFIHLMAIMLWIAGIGALIARMPELAIAVWAVNVINGAFSFFQEFRAEKATEALKKILPAASRVMRDGEEKKVLAEEIVPGDVIFLQEGDSISADCRLINSSDLRVNQSTLTGESRAVNRSAELVGGEGLTETEIPNLVFAGTFVAAGSGKAIVYATGMNTAFGRIARLTQDVKEELSPLQQEMKSMTKIVTLIAVGVGLLFLLLSLFFARMTVAEAVIFSIGMVVAFVPEGLLPTVTLSLAMATQRMAKRNALIKKLSSVETLGCTNVICTDKTGTLTQNEMTVRDVWLPTSEDHGRVINVAGIGYEPVGELTENGQLIDAKTDYALSSVILTHARCNTSKLLPPEPNGSETVNHWRVLGDPTEAALVVLANKAGFNSDEFSYARTIAELPFDSRRKRMTVVELTANAEGRFERRAYVKGGIREILDACDSILIGGEIQPITEERINKIMAVNDDYARLGLRVLAAATRVLPDDFQDYLIESVECNLTFLGMVAMQDPPRPDVTAAVKKCHSAGIRIVMITGDYGLTAESIARNIGIVEGQNLRIVTGVELENMSDEDLKDAVKDEVIFARVAPEHKLKVVNAFQELGNVVAVTGDGVNDAPALKKANIGVAMGITGSDVAKEAASMILTDDNFGSIVNAIEEGRAVYENIKRFCTYIFTSNTPEALPFVLYALSGSAIPLALRVMQVLAVDLGTDIVPALGLGAEPPEQGIMEQPPRKLSDHLITKDLLSRAYLILGPVQALVAMVSFYFFLWTINPAFRGLFGPGLPNETFQPKLYYAATAMAFGGVVMSQIGNLFAQRASKRSIFKVPLFNNKLIWIGIASEILLTLAIVYVPFMNKFVQTAPFPPRYWLFLILWIPILPIVDAIRKAVIGTLKTNRQKREASGLKGEVL
ncbi:MAG TPA: cation-transporting P-type ATPase [Anaerolineaceae bacterium]|nr:cation-transporting P-type ATPase [Anaerolineaceae bacterium]